MTQEEKDALIAWAKETYLCENASMIRKVCYKQLLEHLDTLEVKEMDKNNEIIDKLKDIINFHKEKVLKGQWYNYMPEKVSYHNGIISGIKQCLSIIRNR